MSWTTLLAIYFIVWWVVLFAVLPWGIRSQQEQGEIAPGTDPGAPAVPALLSKVIWTTVVATVVCGLIYGAYVIRLVTLEDLATLWGRLK